MMNNIWTCHCGLNKPERFSKGLTEVIFCPKCHKHTIIRHTCNHEITEKVRIVIDGGGYQLRDICKLCHRVLGKSFKFESVPAIEKVPVLPRKQREELENKEYNNYLKIAERIRIKEKAYIDATKEDQAKDYSEYIKSSRWKSIRQKALDRDNHLCQSCLFRRASEVHHKTYAFLKNEPIFSLVSLCPKCHREIHNMLRGDHSEDIHAG